MSTPTRATDESFASLFEQASAGRPLQRRYHVGENVEVAIVAVAREAVFADLGGKQEGVFERAALSDAEGKLHIEVGSRVSAVVSSIDFATGQVRLSPVVIRTADAGDIGVAHTTSAGAAGPVFVEGSRVKGKVTGIERYGVFVQIAGTSGRTGRGLVPASETGTPRNADLKKHFAVGQEVETKILSIDESGKIRLSIAALGADDERGMFEAFRASQGKDDAGAGADAAQAGAPAAGGARKEKAKPEPRNFGTLGDLLGKGLAPAPAKPSPATKAPATKSAKPSGKRVMVDAGAAKAASPKKR